MKEIWAVVAWAPKYKVSNYGNLVNTETNKPIAGTVNNRGYRRYDLCVNGKRIVKSGHRLVAEAFLEKVDGKPLINHKDGNKLNNRADNLEWCTSKENSQHAHFVLGVEPPNKKAVRCVETGVVYESCCEAERKTGIQNAHINLCCNKKRKTARNLHWEFVDNAGVV